MKYYAEWDGKTRVIEIARGTEDTDAVVVTVDGVAHAANLATVAGSGLYSLILDDASFAFTARFEGGTAVLAFHDREVRVPVEDERAREARAMTSAARRPKGPGALASVMPGVVKEVRVAVGDAVRAGQPLIVLEAMKMENEIRAPGNGVVTALHVRVGQAVEKGAPLVTLTASPG